MSDDSQGEAHRADEASGAPAGTGVTTLVADFEQKSTFNDPIPAHSLANGSESALSVTRVDKSSSKSKSEAFKADWAARYLAKEIGHVKALEVNVGTDATSLKSSSNKKRSYGESVHGDAKAEPSKDVNNSSRSHSQVPTSPGSSITQSLEEPGTLIDDPPSLQPASAGTSQAISDAIPGADQDSLSVCERFDEINAVVSADDTESPGSLDEDAVDGFGSPLEEAIGIPDSFLDEDDNEFKNWYDLEEDAIKRAKSGIFSVYKALCLRQALRRQTTPHKNVYQTARGRVWIGTHFYLILD
ncbi:hypothetical protein B0A48_01495 [Cryoendolithus antarcticus]|uniref:Uncharacterized protein n=1 Tax=Cryoendolithus antarcticus TaxID=1507870 RepID=A0A1V8TPG3_9PEZI|nr:hypothetical protein B0A48_01495 [Cryoendolithus antarcticus]